MDRQLFCDALLGFKSVPVHLRLLQRAHLLFLSPDTTQDVRHACWPFGAANTTGVSFPESHIHADIHLGRHTTVEYIYSDETL